jgi:hypothetical protein
VIWLLILLPLYVVGWAITAVIATRQISYGSVDFVDAIGGSFLGLIWPLLALPGSVYMAIRHMERQKKQRRVMPAYELAQLEVQAGLRPRDTIFDL